MHHTPRIRTVAALLPMPIGARDMPHGVTAEVMERAGREER